MLVTESDQVCCLCVRGQFADPHGSETVEETDDRRDDQCRHESESGKANRQEEDPDSDTGFDEIEDCQGEWQTLFLFSIHSFGRKKKMYVLFICY